MKCNNCALRDAKPCMECSMCMSGDSHFKSIPKVIKKTNADRIRAMSDEELSEFISRIEIGDFGQQVYGKTFCDMCKGQYECDDCRLWWLQQLYEGE